MSLSSIQNLDSRLQVLVYLACLGDIENAFDLYNFTLSAYEKPLVEATQEILNYPKKERKKMISRGLQDLLQAEKIHPMGEVDAGWFLEVLKEESPRIIGIILKYLPGEKSRFIQENLPAEIQSQLPSPDEKPAPLPEDLLSIIKTRFESQFKTLSAFDRSDEMDLNHFYFIKTSRLIAFFRQLGMEQLSKAFKGLHKSAMKALLYRLSTQDAREFQARMKSLAQISSRELREAQMLLINLPIETLSPESLFTEIGMMFFAKSFTRKDKALAEALYYKLPPKLAYLLKRYMDEGMANSPGSQLAAWVKKQVLQEFQKMPS